MTQMDDQTMRKIFDRATHIEVEAQVRYWEDASVNGAEDAEGTLIPGRVGDLWKVKINLADGTVMGWPDGTEASIYYKVCDQGLYWLTDAEGNRIAKYRSYYVPDEFLCHGDQGFGDYIIFEVGPDGKIINFDPPLDHADLARWEEIPHG